VQPTLGASWNVSGAVQCPRCDYGLGGTCERLPHCTARTRSPRGVNKREQERAVKRAEKAAAKRRRAEAQLAAASKLACRVARGDPAVADPDKQLVQSSVSALAAADSLLGWLINGEEGEGEVEEEDGEEGEEGAPPPPPHGSDDDFQPPPPPSAGHLNLVAVV